MVSCCIRTCSNTVYNTKQTQIQFFRVPAKRGVRQSKWIEFIRKPYSKHLRICSEHFNLHDFEIGNSIGKLTKESIPSISNANVRPKRKKKSKKFLVQNATRKLKKKYEAEIHRYKKRIAKMQNKILSLSRDKLNAESKCDRLLKKISELDSTYNKIARRFSPSQIHTMVKEKSKTWWPDEDISRSLALLVKSKNAYQYLRKTLHYPLPSISTIARHLAKIPMEPGINHAVLSLMKIYFQDLPNSSIKREAIISHDEMNLDATISYDPSSDKIWGPHKNASVVVVRGLFADWKFPIFYGFDEKYTKETFDSILRNLHEFGINVVGITCDNSGTNRGIWNRLGKIDHNVNYFMHPVKDEPVFAISDVPHNLKLLRNNLMDYGLILKDGTEIRREVFVKLLEKLRGLEINICHKLTSKHIYAKGNERQNVALAAQLFSRRTAQAMRELFPQKSKVADFVQLVNDAFDILNSRTTNTNCKWKKPYGINLLEQDAILDQFVDELKGLRMIRARCQTLFPFQKGFIMSINSLRAIYRTQKIKHNIEFIFAHRLNQDILESAFGKIRGMGGFKVNPNCTDFKYRLRKLSICWHFHSNETVGNLELDADEDPEKFTINSMQIGKPVHETSLTEIIEAELKKAEQADAEIIDASNWEEYMRKNNIAEIGGEEYMVGFILRKFQEKFPEYVLTGSELERTPLSYTQRLSNGHLVIPSYTIMNLYRQFEKYFTAFHNFSRDKWKLNRQYNVTLYLAERIKTNFKDVPEKLILYYIRLRTFIRIGYLNKKLDIGRSMKRNAAKNTQFARSRVVEVDSDAEEGSSEEIPTPESVLPNNSYF